MTRASKTHLREPEVNTPHGSSFGNQTTVAHVDGESSPATPIPESVSPVTSTESSSSTERLRQSKPTYTRSPDGLIAAGVLYPAENKRQRREAYLAIQAGLPPCPEILIVDGKRNPRYVGSITGDHYFLWGKDIADVRVHALRCEIEAWRQHKLALLSKRATDTGDRSLAAFLARYESQSP